MKTSSVVLKAFGTVPLGGVALSALLLSGGASCSSEEGAGGAAPDDGDPAPASHVDAAAIPEPFRFDSVQDPWPSVSKEVCDTFDGYDTKHPINRACLCESCLDLVHQCDALPGCVEIRQCAYDDGCNDTFSCYLAAPAGRGCVEVIDKWGNTGLQVAIFSSLTTCATSAACPAPTGN